jgi:hypothetical protein
MEIYIYLISCSCKQIHKKKVKYPIPKTLIGVCKGQNSMRGFYFFLVPDTEKPKIYNSFNMFFFFFFFFFFPELFFGYL